MGKQCECGISQSSFFEAHDTYKKRKWCVLCPSKPLTAVSCRVNNKCVCGKAFAYMSLPYDLQSNSKKWCKKCPTRPENAIIQVSKKVIILEKNQMTKYAAIILMQMNRSSQIYNTL